MKIKQNNEESFRTRFLLALFPVTIVLILLSVELVVSQHLLFTSLISSTFLIYMKHDSPMNDSATIAISQGVAAITGLLVYLIGGRESYISAAITLLIVLVLLLWLDRLHPPALATSLIFNYRDHDLSQLLLFALLVLLVVLLILSKIFYKKFYNKMIPKSDGFS